MRFLRFKQFIIASIAVSVVLAVSGATAGAHDDHAGDQWPTTCVDLNDIVEAHLGNTENVGIYQRTFGDGAEAACQNDHRPDVTAAFYWAIATFVSPSGQVVSKQYDQESVGTGWPATCVGLNDVVEGHLGNISNVGIYQATFGDQAEQACRNDHGNDVRSAFHWAKITVFLNADDSINRVELGEYQPISLAPTPAPQPGFVLHYTSPGGLVFVVDLPANAYWVSAASDDVSIYIYELGELDTRHNEYEPNLVDSAFGNSDGGTLLPYAARYLINVSDYDSEGWQVKFGASRHDLARDTTPQLVPGEAFFTGVTYNSYGTWYGSSSYTSTYENGRLTDIFSCRFYSSGGYYCD